MTTRKQSKATDASAAITRPYADLPSFNLKSRPYLEVVRQERFQH